MRIATLFALLVPGAALAGGASLDIDGAGCPGDVTVTVTGATPGGTIAFLRGLDIGSDVVARGACAGSVSNLAGLRFMGAVTDGDGDGVHTFTPTLPDGSCSAQVQVLDMTTCSFTNVIDLSSLGGPVWSGEWDVTPASGAYINGDDPSWAEKGYVFTADASFDLVGGAWLLDLPADGYVQLRVYDYPSYALLAEGPVGDYGAGVEDWYEAFVDYPIVAGNSYLVAFYTNRAATALFPRQNGPSYGYSVGPMSNLTHWASDHSGDDAIKTDPADGFYGNTWAPYQVFYTD